MSGRYSEIDVLNLDGVKTVLKLVFTLGALAAIEKALGRPMTQTFRDIGADGIRTVLYHGTREAHSDLSEADLDKLSQLPLIKIAEAYNRDIGALAPQQEATPTVGEIPAPPTE
jgi:hypothetical protein